MKSHDPGSQDAVDVFACGVCGGDGKLTNSWGQVGRCPACGGSGRRRDDGGFRDVTKTKPSHHRGSNVAATPDKPTWPSTAAGAELATQIRDSSLAADVKAKLTREILEHEATHGQCTQTFLKKIRKVLRPAMPR